MWKTGQYPIALPCTLTTAIFGRLDSHYIALVFARVGVIMRYVLKNWLQISSCYSWFVNSITPHQMADYARDDLVDIYCGLRVYLNEICNTMMKEYGGI